MGKLGLSTVADDRPHHSLRMSFAQQVCYEMPLGAVNEQRLQAELLAYPESGHDIVRTVAVDARSGLTSDDRYQTLQQKIRLGRLGRVFFASANFSA